ncbi:MAG: cytochrome P450 [Sandaracinaceae bacterium]|nr:cytochrome P450 [Sandaracinaceae bacterium]
MGTERTDLVASSAGRLSDLPQEPGLPYFGIVLSLKPERAHLDLEAIALRHGRNFGYRFLGRPGIGIVDAEVARSVFQDRPDAIRRFMAIEEELGAIGLLGVFAAEGKDWRRQRRLINPSFHAAHLDSFAEAIERVTARFSDHLSHAAARGDVLDVVAELMRYTVDITTSVAFGRDFDSIGAGDGTLQKQLGEVFRGINRRLFSPIRYWRYLPFLDRSFNRAVTEMHAFMKTLVEERRAELHDSPPAPGHRSRTLLESMIRAHDEEGAEHPLTDDEIIANVFTVLLAGEDTTANTVAWALHYLATRPDVFAHARAEVDAALGDALVPTLEQAKHFQYIDAIVHESLRLRSPAPFAGLETTRDTVIGGVMVPKGAMVSVLTRLISTSPANFGDPDSFRPERWLSHAPEDTRPHNPRALMAFGSGPRVCPGRGLALLEAAMVLAMIVRRFDLEAVDSASVREVLAFTMQPEGVRVRFHERKDLVRVPKEG